jgi:1A family penicillin-binding protein
MSLPGGKNYTVMRAARLFEPADINPAPKRRRPRRLKLPAQNHARMFVAAMLVLAAGFWFTMGATALAAHQLFNGLPDRHALGRVSEMARSSVFYDIKGYPAFTIFKEQRLEVPIDKMSPNLRKAMLAIEDQRFYEHHGVDVIRVVGAAVANVRQGRNAQGGSTITQQLARMSFLTQQKTYTRKAQEALLAALIENEYSKDQILELYLNKVYFGGGLYGAEAASLGYFGKHASDLTVAEAALLAGLVKAPSNYAPTANLERAVQRRALVLQAMYDGKMIDKAQFEAAKGTKVALSDALRKDEPYGRYFKEAVRQELITRFGEERVYEGGLKVYTTIDIEVQRAADDEVKRALAVLDKRKSRRSEGELQAALVAIDPRSGEVRALVGGRDFATSNFNRASQAKRQPGSAFKPFVYAAALEAGYTPATVIDDLDSPIATVQGAWVPEDGHSTASSMTMRTALKTSSNRAAVRMLQDLGISKAVAYAQRVGFGNMPSVPSLALGAGEVTLESLTTAYSVFAAGGLRRTPVYIRKVEDQSGTVLFETPYVSEQVLTPQTAYLMTSMLGDVVNHGTAWRARQLGFKLPAAGKTGTTNEYRDAWFIGFTPRLVSGVWIGFDQPQTIMGGGYAAEVAVPLWAGFMKKATAKDPSEWYAPPPGIVSANVCRLSGKRPSEACYGAPYIDDEGEYKNTNSVYTEYFVKGTQPDEYCDIHGSTSLFGRVAGWIGGASPTAPQQERASEAANRDRDRDADDVRHADRDDDDDDDVPEIAAQPEQPRKKRGFWSKVFGVGKDDDDRARDAEKKRKKEEEKRRKEREREQR